MSRNFSGLVNRRPHADASNHSRNWNRVIKNAPHQTCAHSRGRRHNKTPPGTRPWRRLFQEKHGHAVHRLRAVKVRLVNSARRAHNKRTEYSPGKSRTSRRIPTVKTISKIYYGELTSAREMRNRCWGDLLHAGDWPPFAAMSRRTGNIVLRGDFSGSRVRSSGRAIEKERGYVSSDEAQFVSYLALQGKCYWVLLLILQQRPAAVVPFQCDRGDRWCMWHYCQLTSTINVWGYV